MGSQFSQFFPPQPTFTGANIGSQNGKVFLITGGYSGIGLELAKILYQKGGKVYIAGRSQERARQAIQQIESSSPTGGSLHFLAVKLDDLSTIKESADTLIAKERKLDVLWNNAGVSQPPVGSLSHQGFELQFATNCLGPFLFTQLLMPLLEIAAVESQSSITAAGRVVWLSSQIMELSASKGAIAMSDLLDPSKDQTRNYITSKTVNYLLASELAHREGRSKGIISVSINPGAANTKLFRHTPWLKFLARPLLYRAELAAYTELYAGISPDITLAINGCYIVPWGRVSTSVREDLVVAARPSDQDGSGRATEVWEFCEQATREYRT